DPLINIGNLTRERDNMSEEANTITPPKPKAPAARPPKDAGTTAVNVGKIQPGVFWLVAFAVALCLGCVAWLVITNPLPQLKYALGGALLCFACAIVAGLILAGKAEISGRHLGLAVSMSGPAVVWIGAFVIFRLVAPLPDDNSKFLEQVKRAQEADVHWTTYT